ncbi:MAG: hypothetical protein MR821_06280 [Clostridiales bacterium]|nr:hypothetical protein [Clostridiales bacterium]
MRKALKIAAIAALLVTVAGAGVLLYAMNTLSPQVVQMSVLVTPAAQAQDVFDETMAQLDAGAFSGRVYGSTDGLSAEGCSFVTCTVRLANRGFFPAEWITLDIVPAQAQSGGDVLELPDAGAYVLASGSTGDISATVLTTAQDPAAGRVCRVTCYVFGREITLEAAQ